MDSGSGNDPARLSPPQQQQSNAKGRRGSFPSQIRRLIRRSSPASLPFNADEPQPTADSALLPPQNLSITAGSTATASSIPAMPFTVVQTLSRYRQKMKNGFGDLLTGLADRINLAEGLADGVPDPVVQAALQMFVNVAQAVQKARAIKMQALFLLRRIVTFFDTMASIPADKEVPQAMSDLLKRLCNTLVQLELLLHQVAGKTILRRWLSQDELALTMSELVSLTPTPSDIFLVAAHIHHAQQLEESQTLLRSHLRQAEAEDYEEVCLVLSQTSTDEQVQELLEATSPRERAELLRQVNRRLEQTPEASEALRLSPYDRDVLLDIQKRLMAFSAPQIASLSLPDARTPAHSRSTLPSRPISFRGRSGLAASIVSAVLNFNHIAILGAGGVGKSTCARAVVHEAQVVNMFGPRRYFVRCDACTSAEALLSAVAVNLRISGDDLEAAIIVNLESSSPTLLILDNFETPWEQNTPTLLLVEDFLGRVASTPETSLIVTMRGKETPGTSVPWTRLPSISPLAPLSPEASKEAFVDRVPTHQDDPDLHQLIASLDGLPLAIDLMARVAESAPNLAVLLRQWEEQHTSMLRRLPDSNDRETSLEASLKLSLQSPRIPSSANSLLRLLALTPDGMAVEDLDKVATEANASAYALRRTSLAYDDDHNRLRMLAPVRMFILRQYPAGDTLRQTVISHYFGLVELAADLHTGSQNGREVLKRLTPEMGNITTLINWELQDSHDVLRATLAALRLLDFFYASGLGSENILLLALQHPAVLVDLHLQIRIHIAVGYFLMRRNKNKAAVERVRLATDLIHEAGDHDEDSLGDCYYILGDSALKNGNLAESAPLFKRGLNHFLEAQNTKGQGWCTFRLGCIGQQTGDLTSSWDYLSTAEGLFKTCEDFRGLANVYYQSAQNALDVEDWATSISYLEKAKPLSQSVGDLRGQGHIALRLGHSRRGTRAWDAAMENYGEALAIYRSLSNVRGQGSTTLHMGMVATEQMDFATATARLEEAERIARVLSDGRGIARCQLRFGDLGIAQKEYGKSRQSYTSGKQLFQKLGHMKSVADCTLGMGDAVIGLAASDSSIDTGQARSAFEEALEMYRKMSNEIGVGYANVRLARLEDGARREQRLLDTAASWKRLGRLDLIQGLRGEFANLFSEEGWTAMLSGDNTVDEGRG